MFFKKVIEHSMECICCGEKISTHNVRTRVGLNEISLSGLCEVCFDDSTLVPEDNITVLDEFVLSIVAQFRDCVLAGGALRKLINDSDIVCDYDLFFVGKNPLDSIEKIKNILIDRGFTNIFTCPQGSMFTYKNSDGVKVQIIYKKTYSNPDDLIKSFDINACAAAWDGERFYKLKRFCFDNLNRIVTLNTVEYPVASFRRVLKYQEKGFYVPPTTIVDYIYRVKSIETTSENMAFYID